jgi:hypothetical protein
MALLRAIFVCGVQEADNSASGESRKQQPCCQFPLLDGKPAHFTIELKGQKAVWKEKWLKIRIKRPFCG